MYRNMLIVALAVCVVTGSTATIAATGSAKCWKGFKQGRPFKDCQVVSPDVAVYWKVEPSKANSTEQTVLIGIDAMQPNAGSWISLGLSEAGGMKGSDMWIIGPKASLIKHMAKGTGSSVAAAPLARQFAGKYMVLDTWSTDFAAPIADSQQNVELVSVDTASNRGRWLVQLRRAVVTCDPKDLSLSLEIPNFVVWALGGSNPYPSMHVKAGNSQIQFGPGKDMSAPPSAAELAASQTLRFTMPEYRVASDVVTQYMCSNFEVPIDKKYHIIQYKAIINTSVVHHMILYACKAGSKPPPLGTTFECSSMPEDCQSFTLGWAPGPLSQVTNLIPEAGFPVGKDSYQFFSLQVHYNNIDSLTNLVDATGFEILITSQLRREDLRVLTLGQRSLVLPPGLQNVKAEPNVCTQSCLKRSRPVKMVYILPHMHQIGSTISTRHFRNGTELRPLAQRQYWDFNFQPVHPIPYDSADLLPGDSLMTTCSFDTSSRSETTTFGLASQDEMCFSFLAVYDAPETSSPSKGAVASKSAELSYCVSQGFDMRGQKGSILICASEQEYAEGSSVNTNNPSSVTKLFDYLSKGMISMEPQPNTTWPGNISGDIIYRESQCSLKRG